MILVDTSAWIRFINPKYRAPENAQLRTWIESGEAALCEMVCLELQSANPAENKMVELLRQTLPRLDHTEGVWNLAGELSRASRKRGRPVPNSDILIFATARYHECTLFHDDKHYNWLAEIGLP